MTSIRLVSFSPFFFLVNFVVLFFVHIASNFLHFFLLIILWSFASESVCIHESTFFCAVHEYIIPAKEE